MGEPSHQRLQVKDLEVNTSDNLCCLHLLFCFLKASHTDTVPCVLSRKGSLESARSGLCSPQLSALCTSAAQEKTAHNSFYLQGFPQAVSVKGLMTDVSIKSDLPLNFAIA